MGEQTQEAAAESEDTRSLVERFTPSDAANSTREAAKRAKENRDKGIGWIIRKDGSIEAVANVGPKLKQAYEPSFAFFTFDEARIPSLVGSAKMRWGI